MSHTPGPWHVWDTPDPMLVMAEGKAVATVETGKYEDADLMASAPVLLEQRDELLAALEESVRLHLPQGGSCRVRAEAAIAKAKGAPAGRST